MTAGPRIEAALKGERVDITDAGASGDEIEGCGGMTRIKHLRWWITALLFWATLINYVDRQVLSVLAPVLRDELGITNVEYSRIVFVFLLAYMVMQTGSGRLMDWLGTRRGFSLTVVWWSIAAMLHALARSAIWFGTFRFLLGLGEAGNWPGAVKAVAEWFPAEERARATGLFNAGGIAGAVVAAPLVPWLAVWFGWRATFVITGLLGLVWLVPWLLIYRLPKHHPWITPGELRHIQGTGTAAAQAPIPWRSLFGYRQVWGLVFCRMLADPIWFFYVFWLPEYLRRERQFTMSMIGYSVWIPFFTGGIGSFAGGIASDYLVRRGWLPVRARKTVMAVSAVVMLAGIPAALTSSSVVAVGLISTTTFAYCAWATNVLSLPADLFPTRVVASVLGISGTGAAAGSMLFMLAVGAMVERFSYTPVFVVAGFLVVAAAAVLLWTVRESDFSATTLGAGGD